MSRRARLGAIAAAVFVVTSAADAVRAWSSPPAPGTTIDKANLAEFTAIVPSALGFAIEHGLVVDVVPTRHIAWPAKYQRATEQ